MPERSERSEARDKAFELWRASKGKMPLVGIAEFLGVPPSKVRKWKCLDDWESKLGGKPAKRSTKKSKKTRSPTKKKNAKKTAEKNSAIFGNNFSGDDGAMSPKQGQDDPSKQINSRSSDKKTKEHGNKTALLGNKNAVGHGAPKGNRNAVKTGEHQKVCLETMTEDEWEIYNSAPLDAVAALEEELRTQAVRKYRMEKLYRTMAQRKEDVETTDIYEFADKDTVVNAADDTGESHEVIIKQRQKVQVRSEERRRTMDDKMLAATQAAVRVDRQRLSAIIEKAKLEQGQKALELKERKLDAEDW